MENNRLINPHTFIQSIELGVILDELVVKVVHRILVDVEAYGSEHLFEPI